MTTPHEKSFAADASSPDEPVSGPEIRLAIEKMEAEILEFDRLMAEAEQAVINLRRDEDVPAGRVHAKAIFDLQQERLVCDTERLLRVNRIKRLKIRLMDAAEDDGV